MQTNELAQEDALINRSVRILRGSLALLGAWPSEALGQRASWVSVFLKKYLPMQTLFLFVGQTSYLMNAFSTLSFFDLGHMYITNILTCRLILPKFKKYSELTRNFIMEFHLIHHKHKGSYYKKMYERVERLSFYFSLYLISTGFMSSSLFNITPLYKNYKMGVFKKDAPDNVTLEFSVYYKYPGLVLVDHFYGFTIYNYLMTLEVGTVVCAYDYYLSVLAFQIIGHVEILRNSLENLAQPKGQVSCLHKMMVEVYDEEENRMIHEKLKDWVNHHNMIVSFADDISSFFGPTLGLYYLFHSVCCCLLLMECFRGDPEAMANYGPITFAIIGQLIQISVVFEVLNTVSVKLIDAVYDVPWEVMSVSNQKSVLLILKRVQNPLKVTAMGMVPVGVETMAAILKTSFSYFMLLRSMSE